VRTALDLQMHTTEIIPRRASAVIVITEVFLQPIKTVR
jgi:hypothetical protein